MKGIKQSMAKTKYSYIYNNVVVRNSNRIYEYGLVNHNDAVIACSSTEKGALKEKVSTLNFLKRNLEWEKKHDPQYVAGTQRDIENTEKWHTVKLIRKDN